MLINIIEIAETPAAMPRPLERGGGGDFDGTCVELSVPKRHWSTLSVLWLVKALSAEFTRQHSGRLHSKAFRHVTLR